MPKFTIKLMVTNNSGVSVKAHVGASLVGAVDYMEYYNTAEDITMVFPTGRSIIGRYLTSDLGRNQKYNLVVALWEGEKPIGHGTKYKSVTVYGAVEKKKKVVVDFALVVNSFSPSSFIGK